MDQRNDEKSQRRRRRALDRQWARAQAEIGSDPGSVVELLAVLEDFGRPGPYPLSCRAARAIARLARLALAEVCLSTLEDGRHAPGQLAGPGHLVIDSRGPSE